MICESKMVMDLTLIFAYRVFGLAGFFAVVGFMVILFSGRSADGGDGLDAGRIYRRLYCEGRRHIFYASVG